MSEGEDWPRAPAERVRLTLGRSASPSRVRLVAELFEVTLRELAASDDEITLVIDNRDMAAELRGWAGDGAKAVQELRGLVQNPVRALQSHPELAPAAFELAKSCRKLLAFDAQFWDGDGNELASVDKVFVKVMRAAAKGASTLRVAGDTVVYSPILQLGRRQPGSRLSARIKLHGRFQTATVAAELEPLAWTIARSGATAALRVRGVWVRHEGRLSELEEPEIFDIDESYRETTGAELLAEVSARAESFANVDFDALIENVRRAQED